MSILYTVNNGQKSFTEWLAVQAQINPGRPFDAGNGSVYGDAIVCPIASWLRTLGYTYGYVAPNYISDYRPRGAISGNSEISGPCAQWAQDAQRAFIKVSFDSALCDRAVPRHRGTICAREALKVMQKL